MSTHAPTAAKPETATQSGAEVLLRALKEQGVVFDTEPADEPWLWREARLRDPDGNVLCLYRAGVNRRNPPWRVR